MKTMIAEIKQQGPSFHIPVQVDEDNNIIEFTQDMMPVNQQEQEDIETGNEEAARFAAWDQQQHDRQMTEFENWK